MTDTKNKLFYNFSFLAASHFTVQGLRFLTIALLARSLSLETFGQYNYILMIVTLCGIIVEFGLKNYGIREFATGQGGTAIVYPVFKIRFVAALGSALLTGLLCLQAFRSKESFVVSLCFSLGLFVDAFLIDYIAIAKEELKIQAVAQVLQALGYLLLVFVLTRVAPHDLLYLGFAFALSKILCVGYYFLKTPLSSLATGHWVPWKAVIWGGIPFLVANILSTLNSQMDLFLLGQFHFDFLLGDYSACLKILQIPVGIAGSFLAALQPRLAQAHGDAKVIKGHLMSVIPLLVGGTLAMITVFWLWGDRIISLFFGGKYFLGQLYIGPLSIVAALFIWTLAPMTAHFVSRQVSLLLKIVVTNFILSAVIISLCLWMHWPEAVPWGMCVVQFILVVQSWRPFTK